MSHHIETLFESETISAIIFYCSGKTSQCEHAVEEIAPEHQIVFPLKGLFMRYDAFGRFVSDSNQMLFFNRDQAHEISHPIWGSDTSLILSFRDDVLFDMLEYREPAEMPFSDAYRLLDSKQQLMKHRLLMVLADSQDELRSEEAILWSISALIEQDEKGISQTNKLNIEQSEAVFNVQYLMNQSFRETITLHELARQVHYSEYTLCRIFKQQIGTTIYQYLSNLRLVQALQDLVEYPPKAIGEIGMELGFSSPSHFSTCFLNSFGMSPSEFREEATEAKIHDMKKHLKITESKA